MRWFRDEWISVELAVQDNQLLGMQPISNYFAKQERTCNWVIHTIYCSIYLRQRQLTLGLETGDESQKTSIDTSEVWVNDIVCIVYGEFVVEKDNKEVIGLAPC